MMQTVRRVGKYEVGRTLGEGTFAKVKFAVNTETGESVAMKILDKEKILKHKMVEQIKREISIMKLVRHPNVVHLHEVLASRTKIYIVLELVTGGELFDKIVHQGKLPEDEARRYFQQLVDAVDFCHSKGVFHRDLKPENLLLDAKGNLKISDFGLSALPMQVQDDGLLHTTCGTPNYVAPEVLNDKGYDGALADIWSCGVILYVLMAGYLPFDEQDLMTLYKKIHRADFTCPSWFSLGVKAVLRKLLDPNPKTRIRVSGLRNDPWFTKGYHPVQPLEENTDDSDDVAAVFGNNEDSHVSEQKEQKEVKPHLMNAFELITLSQGLNLSTFFEKRQDHMVKRQTRFTSKRPAKEIVQKIATAASAAGFTVATRNYKIRMEGRSASHKGILQVAVEVFEMAPGLHMVEVRKAGGDTLEYHKFYKLLCQKCTDIIWKSELSAMDGSASKASAIASTNGAVATGDEGPATGPAT
ncbi:SNF1-related protein kinase [Klebsormidium nitens]|uniref:non-specific serine/threonine protein kinase n=1 Tax=Klebsormidium nitens TaxID=105231 RepID=A0A1Y1I0F2_KLENI|nr:SNF1-related protein kinase [Klebsormidium nitens]|eukprot:GAQ84395.1 SNF1-related protein kinase [Klebsormidium nitens]